MFDVGLSEILLFAIVALVVLGPEKLPHAVRIAGAWVGRIRRSLSDIQSDIERQVSVQEMKDRLRKQAEQAGVSDVDGYLREAFAGLDESAGGMRRHLDALKQDLVPPPASSSAAPSTILPPSTVDEPSIQNVSSVQDAAVVQGEAAATATAVPVQEKP